MSARLLKCRLAKNGPLCAVKIWRGFPIDPVTLEELTERPEMWRCAVNGVDTPIDDVAIQIEGSDPVVKGDVIDQATYDFMVADAQWCAAHASHLPEAKPRESVDLHRLPPVF